MFSRIATLIFVILVATTIGGPPPDAHAGVTATEPEKLEVLLGEFWEDFLMRSPITATSVGDPRYNDRFPNSLTEEWRIESRAFNKHWLERLSTIDRKTLHGQDRLSYDIVRRDLESNLEGLQYPGHLLPINPLFGVPTFLARLGSGEAMQPFKTVKDYDDFLKRLDGGLVWMDQAILNMREGVEIGVVQPRTVMEKVVPQLDNLIVANPEESVFWGPIGKFPESFSETDRNRLTTAYHSAIADKAMPAYIRLRDFIRDEYLPECRASVGFSELPNGGAWYAYNVKQNTTTDLDPETIHEMGLREVKRILGEMDAVREQVGFDGNLATFFDDLKNDDRFYFSDGQELIDGYTELRSQVRERLPALFDIFPSADYEVRPVEAYRAASAPGAQYTAPAPDGSRPGIFYVNTSDLKGQPRFSMESLSLHEGSPGHHFQAAIAQEVESLPAYRRFVAFYVAYVEGWALYAESLGKELGLYSDPYQWYGKLDYEQLRAMRLVVDTGLHYMGWTRDEAIRYMSDNSSMADGDIVREVDRYIVIPGQALGYKIGQFAIRDLRQEATEALGPDFDIRAFHREMLVDGPLPLDVLRTKTHEWVELKKRAGAEGRHASGEDEGLRAPNRG
jgi:uncharacterized protein (DUF885 family)